MAKSEQIKVDKTGFAARMLQCAKLVGSSQALADKSGVTRRTIGKYTAGESEPNLSNLISMANIAGVTVEWLATGREPMRYDGSAPQPVGTLDNDLLVSIIGIIQEFLDETKTPMPANKYAQLICLLYSHYSAQESPKVEKDNVKRYIEFGS